MAREGEAGIFHRGKLAPQPPPPPSTSRVASSNAGIRGRTHKGHAQTSKHACATGRIRRGFETIGSSRGGAERDNAESTSGPTLSVHHEIEIWPAAELRKRSRRDGRGSVRVLRYVRLRGKSVDLARFLGAPRLQCRWCWFRRDVVERTGRLWTAAAAKASPGARQVTGGSDLS